MQDQIDALEIKRLRLEAELSGALDFSVPDDVADRNPNILTSERALLNARQTDYTSRREGSGKILKQLKEELANLERLYRQDIVALIEVNRAKKAASDAEAKFNEIGTQSELDLAEEYSATLQDLTELRSCSLTQG